MCMNPYQTLSCTIANHPPATYSLVLRYILLWHLWFVLYNNIIHVHVVHSLDHAHNTHTHTYVHTSHVGLVPNGDHSSLWIERDDERPDGSPQRHADHRGHPGKDEKLLRLFRDRKGTTCTCIHVAHTTGKYSRKFSRGSTIFVDRRSLP